MLLLHTTTLPEYRKHVMAVRSGDVCYASSPQSIVNRIHYFDSHWLAFPFTPL